MLENEIASLLLDAQAVKLRPEDPFTWASGIKSPIYCDNRQLISVPAARKIIVRKFTELIEDKYPKTQVIAGTATAGIPWAAWVADELELPLIYVRSKSKGHGLQNQLEGKYRPQQKVILIEDLISTGGSSLKAHQSLKSASLINQAVLAIFTYQFDQAKNSFNNESLPYFTLSHISALLNVAIEKNLITQEEKKGILEWKNSHH